MPKILNELTEMVPVGRLKPHSRNANQGDLGAIYESIRVNGFYGSLIVQRSTGQILIGNHRFAAALRLGFTELPVTWIECSDEEALRVMLSDNRTSRLGLDDTTQLAELLTELAETDLGLAGTAFDGDFLDDLLNELAGPKPKKPVKPKTASAGAAGPDSTGENAGAGENADPGDSFGSPGDRGWLGVIVLCDNDNEQDHVFQRIVDLGWSAQKTTFSEQAFTQLKSHK